MIIATATSEVKPSKEKGDKHRPPSPVSLNTANKGQSDKKVLEKLRKLHKENQEGHNHTKMSLERLEQAVTAIKDQMVEHEERIGKTEEGLSTDTAMRHHRAQRYLLHCHIDPLAKCDDLQNRLRRNNI